MIKKFIDYHLAEGVIDIPRMTLAPKVWDNPSSENPKLKQEVLDVINTRLEKFAKEFPIIKSTLIGSILGHRYRNDADLDINVLFDVPKEQQEEERVRLAKSLRDINGKNIPGTEHPINYYVLTDPKLEAEQAAKADGNYDILKNKWIRKPEKIEFDAGKYLDQFKKQVGELDMVKGELKRDIIDYDELKELSPSDILNLQEKINEKLEEIEDSIKKITDIGDKLDVDRRAGFDTDMTPDQIKQYGIKIKLPSSVIYKYMEKYHYLKFYKKCKEILDDGKVTDKEIASLKKEEVLLEKNVAFTFGRFNPPTIGHEKLINKVKGVRADNHKIYISRSEDSKKNPLSPSEKLQYMKKMFPKHARDIEINTTNMILDVVVKLYKQNYAEITMVVGSDRVREFETILKKYNDVRSRHGYYKFNKISVVSAGERDPDAEGAMGMSASKMRDAAKQGNFRAFTRGLPTSFSDKEKLFKSVRKGMNLAASYGGLTHLSGAKPIMSLEQKQIRDLYIREQLFNIEDTIKNLKENVVGVIKRRGTNHIMVEDVHENLKKWWIWDCEPVSADKSAIVREYDLNIDYGFKSVSEEEIKMTEKTLSEVKNDLNEACWTGYKQVGMKKKGGKQVPNCVPEEKVDEVLQSLTDEARVAHTQGDNDFAIEESYEIGADYANHTKEITPGENPSEKPVDTKKRAEEAGTDKKITKEDIENWKASDTTIDKYKRRYGEEWKIKLEDASLQMHEDLAEQDFTFKSFKDFVK